MNIQKTITGFVVCLVAVSSKAQSQQIIESAPEYMKLPWAMASNCNRISDLYPIGSVGKVQSSPMKINGKLSYPAENMRLDTNKITTHAFLTGTPIAPALVRANHCYLARGHSSPMPIATYAFLTRRSVSNELLAERFRNNNNGEIVVSWLANRSQIVNGVRSNN